MFTLYRCCCCISSIYNGCALPFLLKQPQTHAQNNRTDKPINELCRHRIRVIQIFLPHPLLFGDSDNKGSWNTATSASAPTQVSAANITRAKGPKTPRLAVNYSVRRCLRAIVLIIFSNFYRSSTIFALSSL